MASGMDYRGQNLQARSFRAMTLDGADFTGADLRGADFSDASLVDARFTDSRLGVRPLIGALLLAAALLVSVAAGLVTGWFVTAARERAFSSEWQDLLAGWLLVAVLVAFVLILLRKGILTALRVFLIAAVAVIVLDLVVVFAFGELSADRAWRGLPIIGLLLLFGPAVSAGILGRIVGGAFGPWAIALVAVIGGVTAGSVHGGLGAIAVSLLLVWIAKRTLKEDPRDDTVRRLALRIVARRGTRFTGADVTGADFTGTPLTQADMSGAVLTGAVWDEDKGPVVDDGR